jgi:hypothetical protein
MPAYNFIPIAPHPVRDPNFVSPEEAAKVAAALLAAPLGNTIITQADESQITGVQMVPQVPNLYPDGRVFIVLNFAMPIEVTNSFGRKQTVTVPFSVVAGFLLDSVGKGGQSFKFNAESSGKDSWLGDVEMEGS